MEKSEMLFGAVRSSRLSYTFGVKAVEAKTRLGALTHSLFAVALTLLAMSSSVLAQPSPRNGTDLAGIGFTSNSTTANITYSPGTLSSTWPQPIGNGIELGFLASNFDNNRGDDIAAICFNQSGDARAMTTQSPGTAQGSIWDLALTTGSKLTYYLMPGDFNGDGRGDIAAFYTDESTATPDRVRTKITYGPRGASQTSDPTAGGSPTEDWNLGNARTSAFVAGDFIGADRVDDLAIITKQPDNTYSVRFVRGPNGLNVASPIWNFPAGTPRAFRAGDFDGDGQTDMAAVFVSAAGDYSARIARGPAGTLTPATWSLTDRQFSQFLAGDYNNDGKTDIAGVFNEASLNKAQVEFAPASAQPTVTWNLSNANIRTFVAGDFNSGVGSQNLQATDGVTAGVPNSVVRITYDAVAGAEGYRIFRANLGSASFSALNSSTATLTFDDSTAAPGVIYDYKVRALSSGIESPDSNIDSGYRWNDDGSLAAPTNVQASDGNDTSVEISWNRVGGASGYRIARAVLGSTNFTNLGDTNSGTALNFSDATAVPGVIYLYRVHTLAGAVESGNGPSNIDSGYRDNNDGSLPAPTGVSASDGSSNDRVDVSWNAVGGATGYIIYRADTLNGPGQEVGRTSGTNFSDPTAEACVEFFYYVKAVRGAEVSAESARDAGSRGNAGGCNIPPLAATNLQASDGSSQEFVLVSWTRSRRATAYQLYRSQFVGDTGAPLGQQTTATEIQDISAVPGVRYYYTVKAFNQFGESDFSNTDQGFRALAPGEDPDCDGDGVSDDQETIDGTGICDPGSFQLHLKSPAFTRYNTFLRQQNFLELISGGTRTIEATVTVFSLEGSVIATTTRSIPALQQVDIDIHSLVGRPDTYGVVRVDFNDREPGATLMGRMSHYRSDNDGTYSFAFARELRNPSRGVTFSTANTFDPQAQGFQVPNWAELVNLDNVPRVFSHNIYSQDGTLRKSSLFVLAPLGARDMQAGHEYGEGVYVSEFIPQDGAAKYFASVTRYASNAPEGTVPTSYNFAFPLDSKTGNGDKQYMRITNKTGSCWLQTNWVEVMNVRDKAVTARVIFRDASGAMVGETPFNYAPRSQYHFNASALLPKDIDGSVEVSSSDPGALITQSLVYFHDTCGSNSLQTAYASPGRIAGQDVQAGSFNTNIQMKNQLNIIGTTAQATPVNVEVRADGQLLSQIVNSLGSLSTNALDLNNASIFGTRQNQYGTITLRTPSMPKRIVAENLRVRESVPGKIDFVMMTAIQ